MRERRGAWWKVDLRSAIKCLYSDEKEIAVKVRKLVRLNVMRSIEKKGFFCLEHPKQKQTCDLFLSKLSLKWIFFCIIGQMLVVAIVFFSCGGRKCTDFLF